MNMNCLLSIRNLRNDHDFTQAYVASRLNIGQRTYADCRNNFSNTLEVRLLISAVLQYFRKVYNPFLLLYHFFAV